MVDPKTIDNLGLSPSIRWAQDQTYLDKTLAKEAPFVSRSTQVDVAHPFYRSEFDTLFQTSSRYSQWALLYSPVGFNLQKMRLFTFQIIPSLGSHEFLSSQMQKIRDKVDNSKKARAQRRQEGKGSEYEWEDEKEEEEELRKSKTLITLLDYLQVLDTLLIQINSRRNQYSKG
jgi:hypothetical protein